MYFVPAGVPPFMLEEVCLSVEEVEALRLKDVEKLEEGEGAERMKISRSTFHRLVESARSKVAEALVNGKAIRIEGGNYELAARRFQCSDDGHEWEVPFETLIRGGPKFCPQCRSPNITPLPPFAPGWRWRGGWGRRR